ncbi:MAG: glycosyltransferase family 4 protein [Flavobacteriales bacterium]|nr:glycosyltransferase family 4 protein [Flavobacteriales bacterium]
MERRRAASGLLVQELKDQVDNVVLCSEASKMAIFCAKNNIQHYTQKKRGGFDLSYALRIKSICKLENISCVQLHDAHAHTYAILAAVLGNQVPLILSRRVDFPIKDNFFSSFKYNHAAIKRILCVSNTIKEITSKGINDSSKLFTVYSGIDLTKFEQRTGELRKELGLDENTFLIGNTSALADHKDYFTFLDVAEKLAARNDSCHFVVMGDGPMKAEIHQYAARKKLDHRITFTGFRNDIPKVLAELDLFLITSKTEGLGTSILDAFACKVPVVGTKGGGIIELIEHEKTGLLCEVKNVEQIQLAVEKMMTEVDLRNTVVKNASEKVQLFSKEETAKQTLNHYLAVSR